MISILNIDTRACREFGRRDHLSKSASTRFKMLWKFILVMEEREGKMSMYLKVLITGIWVGNVDGSRDG